MAVFNELRVNETNKPTNQIFVVYTGKNHQLSGEQVAKCQEYLDYLNDEIKKENISRKQKGEKEKTLIGNGDIYTIVNEQRTPDGKTLFLTEKTNYAHFLAFRDQNTDKVKEIFGDVLVPPCPVGNPQTMVIAKPESEARADQGRLGRIRGAMKSRGPVVLLGVMGNQTVFEGTAQAFGAGLNGKNMTATSVRQLKNGLTELGFKLDRGDLTKGAGTWDLEKITTQSIQNQLGVTEGIKEEAIQQLGAVRDNVGNYYWTSVTPVDKTASEMIKGKPEHSKFNEIIRVAADPKKAMRQMAVRGIHHRVYVPEALDRVRQMVRDRPDLLLRGAEKIGIGKQKAAVGLRSGLDQVTGKVGNWRRKLSKREQPSKEEVDR